jgi:Uncharacterized alpha/beta hydrolase domain (DUF2235)
MPKNIVICCDGTGNAYGECNSNVVNLYSTLIVNEKQAAYYHPGVGTMGAPAARGKLETKWSKLKGLAFGSGLLDNIGDAYRFLMDKYEDADRIYLFGFSRGAYTVRGLAGMLHMCGLLCPGNEGLIPYILKMYARRSRDAGGLQSTLAVAEGFKYTFSRHCDVHFAGLWDTVSSVGWVSDPIMLPFEGHNPIVKTGRHAVSIHERRCYYSDVLWGPADQGQDLKQVWFAGVHSDVGGSYPEKQSGLAQNALEWMLVEARAAGLLIDVRKANVVLGRLPSPYAWMPQYVEPNPTAEIHESLHGWWWLLEAMPHRYVEKAGAREVVRHRVPMGRWRVLPESAAIHQSVLMPQSRIEQERLPKDYAIVASARFPDCATEEGADVMVAAHRAANDGTGHNGHRAGGVLV